MSSDKVCLAWVISKGAVTIPKATSLEHLRDNFEALNMLLPSEDLDKIDNIEMKRRLVHPPVVAPKEWKK